MTTKDEAIKMLREALKTCIAGVGKNKECWFDQAKVKQALSETIPIKITPDPRIKELEAERDQLRQQLADCDNYLGELFRNRYLQISGGPNPFYDCYICGESVPGVRHELVQHMIDCTSAARINELRQQLAAAQAKIDALMLEYCPGEMTPEQVEEWGRHQVMRDFPVFRDAAISTSPEQPKEEHHGCDNNTCDKCRQDGSRVVPPAPVKTEASAEPTTPDAVFNSWWNADCLTKTNPFQEDSPAYWAWEGWQASRSSIPEAEPVAWRVGISGRYEYYNNIHSARKDRAEYEISCRGACDHEEPEPVYLHPPSQAVNPVAVAGRFFDNGKWIECGTNATKSYAEMGYKVEYLGVIGTPIEVPENLLAQIDAAILSRKTHPDHVGMLTKLRRIVAALEANK